MRAAIFAAGGDATTAMRLPGVAPRSPLIRSSRLNAAAVEGLQPRRWVKRLSFSLCATTAEIERHRGPGSVGRSTASIARTRFHPAASDVSVVVSPALRLQRYG